MSRTKGDSKSVSESPSDDDDDGDGDDVRHSILTIFRRLHKL